MPICNHKSIISIGMGRKSKNNNQYLLLVSKDIFVFKLDNSVKFPLAMMSLFVLCYCVSKVRLEPNENFKLIIKRVSDSHLK